MCTAWYQGRDRDAMLLSELRVGQTGEVCVMVVEVWEGGSYLAGDSSASLRLVALRTVRPLRLFETVVLDVELQKSSLRLLREKGPPSESIMAIESCGVIVFARDSEKFLAVRDYHTKPFIDVQFKFKAAFDQRTVGLPVDEMLKNITQWSNAELSWVIEWKLQSIWPYITPDRIKQWTPTMRALDAEIKSIYRACKAELARRRQAGGALDVANNSWGFPKGGCKIVRARVEEPVEAAVRELQEETGLDATSKQLERSVDVPRPHGKTFDRWFILELPEEKPIRPPAGAWDVACIEWVSLAQLPPALERFRSTLAGLVRGPDQPASAAACEWE